jgi:hypothetical protein
MLLPLVAKQQEMQLKYLNRPVMMVDQHLNMSQ